MAQVFVNTNVLFWKASIRGCLFLVFVHPVFAQPMIDPLVNPSFGVMAITANNTVSSVEVPASGRNQAASGNVAIIESGQPGRYRLSGFPALTNIDVEVDEASLTAGGTGIPEPLLVNAYETTSVRTNELGEAEFQLGARFSTSGNSGSYEDALYKGEEKMRLHFWAPEAGEYVTVSENITLEGEVRSSFALDEKQPLQFGTLFARATSGHQASMRLFPDGRVSIANPGNAKIVSLSVPAQAVLLVSGAAPYRMLSIAIEQTEIELRHVGNPTGLHFILSDLETAPESSGRTDDTGQLEIAVGGILSTQLTPTEQVYPAGAYEATYSVTVSY